mmetsp:Transcript_48389/g.130401  ORF Transcript_48389/g.130401 Transcript_48389/m.130401 type:complete len:611 (+) Transcript_48389:159-1991(+)
MSCTRASLVIVTCFILLGLIAQFVQIWRTLSSRTDGPQLPWIAQQRNGTIGGRDDWQQAFAHAVSADCRLVFWEEFPKFVVGDAWSLQHRDRQTLLFLAIIWLASACVGQYWCGRYTGMESNCGGDDVLGMHRNFFTRMLMGGSPLKDLDFTISIYFLMQITLDGMAGQSEIDGNLTPLAHILGASTVLASAWRKYLHRKLRFLVTPLVVATAGVFIRDQSHTGRNLNCDHRTLICLYGNIGLALGTLAAHVVGADIASSWVRTWGMTACALMYINAFIAKSLNQPGLFDYWSGRELAHWLLHRVRTSKWPCLNAMAVQSQGVMRALGSLTMLFEGPFSMWILLFDMGPKCESHWWWRVVTGGLSPLRALWAWAAIGFHLSIYIMMAPRYNYQVYTLLILVLDFPRSMLCISQVDPSRSIVARGRLCVFLLCTLSLFTAALWVFVGIRYHLPEDDPLWPVSSVPMYSKSDCPANCLCTRKYTDSEWHAYAHGKWIYVLKQAALSDDDLQMESAVQLLGALGRMLPRFKVPRASEHFSEVVAVLLQCVVKRPHSVGALGIVVLRDFAATLGDFQRRAMCQAFSACQDCDIVNAKIQELREVSRCDRVERHR